MLHPDPIISVIVCTYNRKDIVPICIDSLLEQTFKEYEIIVVDNNSSDGTKELIEERYYHTVKLIREPVQGLSYARNCGLMNARGHIVSYIDDDAIADKNWLFYINKTFTDYPDAVCVGGKIGLKRVGEKPEWWTLEMDQSCGKQDYGEKIRYLNYPEFPFGSNISLKKKVILDIGGFNTKLGIVGKKYSGGEEQYMCLQLYQNKYQIIYSPKSIVHHTVNQKRLTKEFLLARYSATGASHAYMYNLLGKKPLLKEIILTSLHLFAHSLLFYITPNYRKARRKFMITQKISFLRSSLNLAFRRSVM